MLIANIYFKMYAIKAQSSLILYIYWIFKAIQFFSIICQYFFFNQKRKIEIILTLFPIYFCSSTKTICHLIRFSITCQSIQTVHLFRNTKSRPSVLENNIHQYIQIKIREAIKMIIETDKQIKIKTKTIQHYQALLHTCVSCFLLCVGCNDHK